MTDSRDTQATRGLIYLPLQPRAKMVGLSAISAALTMALFGSVGFGTHGWGQFTWLPLAIIAACYSLFLCNLFILRSPRLQVLLTLVLGGLASPAVAVIFAVYVLVAFSEATLTALSVGVLALAPIILLGALEGNNCDLGKIQRLLRRNGQLRRLPDGREAFDTYWEWGLGAEAIVAGFQWRKWLDRAVIAFAILAMPIGATAAFTSASAIPDIPAQWGIATAFLVVAWLLRPMVTAVFGQLAFLRLYSSQTGNR